jgi:predicted transcriptional regulator
MKTATIPALRVHPELRQAAEEMLRPGESLSSFVEDALRRNVELRRTQQLFIARGLASRDAAKQSGNYVPASEVLKKLGTRLETALAKSPMRKTAARVTREKWLMPFVSPPKPNRICSDSSTFCSPKM